MVSESFKRYFKGQVVHSIKGSSVLSLMRIRKNHAGNRLSNVRVFTVSRNIESNFRIDATLIPRMLNILAVNKKFCFFIFLFFY